ncbi:MAG: ABC transporter permease [Gammaproteobacteria bacterium]
MAWFKELLALIVFNIRSWRLRPMATGVAIASFLIVVLVFVGIFSVENGFTATARSTGASDVAMVLSQGARSEMSSSLPISDVGVIESAPGVTHNSNGPLIAGEYTDIINATKHGSQEPTDVTVRGVDKSMFTLEPQVKIVAGRMFKTGVNELIVGRRAAQEFKGFTLGSTVHWLQTDWKVVGIFSSNGDVHESELWTDIHALQNADQNNGNVAAMYAKLTSANAFPAFQQSLEHNPQLSVSVLRQSDYYLQQTNALTRFIASIGGLVTLLMGIGAVVGAMNIMYTTIVVRTSELATLRAIGFQASSTFSAVMIEGLLLGVIGGVVGILGAWLIFNGHQASTLSGYGQVIFNFAVTVPLMILSIGIAVFMGLIGGLYPALRASRLAISVALRET